MVPAITEKEEEESKGDRKVQAFQNQEEQTPDELGKSEKSDPESLEDNPQSQVVPEESKSAAAQQVEETKGKLFTCNECGMEFDSLNKKKKHRKKKQC